MCKRYFAILTIVLLLSGCNLPSRSGQVTPTGDPVSTQVSLLLTQMPTPTFPPTLTSVPANTPVTLASPTTAPTISDTPPPLPTQTPTTPPGDPRSALGNPTWRDTLENSKSFYLYENDNTKVTHADGALLLTGLSANGWLGWSLTYSKPAQNFYLEGVFSPQTCSGSDTYGLIFRSATNESGYFFGATCDGRYNLHARDFSDGSDNTLIELTPGASLQTGSNSVNRLGVMVNGSRIALYSNGSLLQESTDDTFKAQGNFGGFIAANETAGFTAKLDEISVWVLP